MKITNIQIQEKNGIRFYSADVSTTHSYKIQTDGHITKHLNEDEFKQLIEEDYNLERL